jgi:hypothetical protein
MTDVIRVKPAPVRRILVVVLEPRAGGWAGVLAALGARAEM